MNKIVAAAAIGAALVEGTPFGKYRLVALLGRGGMGEVWRAFDTATDRIVALKVLPAHLADDEMFQQRFRREARAAAGLYEPHVVPIHSYGEIDGRLYVDMRLIVGRDLEAVLREGPLDPARAVMIVEQVASALHAAHQIGLIHRDVKPSNILLTDADFAYLIDFGIARVAGETGLTSTGSTLGTWAYMAPERFGAGEADHRSDVYALACVLHQCLTGQLPFPGQSVEQQVAGHLTTPPPRPSAIAAGVPQAFDDVIAKGMAKNPDERYATTRELAQAAQAALMAPREPSPHPTPVAAAAPITQSAEPPQGAITGGSSSATSDTGAGTSSVDAVAEDLNAEKVHRAPEFAIDPAADTRTQAGATVSASDAPTQQAPVSAGKDRLAEARSTERVTRSLGRPLPQRLGRRTVLVSVAFVVAALLAVAATMAIIHGRDDNSAASATRAPDKASTAAPAQPSGKLVVGVNIPYAPAEFLDTSGRVVGFDIDLMNAVASKLGMTVEYYQIAFKDIFPAVSNGTFDVGMSAITDTKKREQTNDFVTYFSAGTQWARRPGALISPDDACGLRVAVQSTTTQDTEDIPAKSDACVAAGKPPIDKVQFDGQDAATNAVVLGTADAMSADSSVTGYAVKQSGGKLEAAGEIYDSAPFGWAVAKGSPLAESLKKALEQLIETGEYRKILTAWGLESGAIKEPVINGAIY